MPSTATSRDDPAIVPSISGPAKAGQYLRVLLWIAYIVTPVAGWGFFDGRPLGLISTMALAAGCWVAFTRGSLTIGSGVAIALLLKIALGMTLLVPRGFDARYYANANFAGPIEASAEPADAGFTRVDHRLRFGIAGERDVPLAFQNELRFNYYRDTEPDRAALPFSVVWQGLWHVATPGLQRLYVHSPGGSVVLAVGDAFSTRLGASGAWSGEVDLPSGFHRVTIGWAVPQGGARRFEAGRLVDGREEPFGDSVIVRRRVGTAALAADPVVRALSRLIDAALCVGLAVQIALGMAAAWRGIGATFRPRDAVALAWAAGILDALVFALPSLGRMVTLSGGDDWLTYESEARDIALHGLWMNEGAPLGHGSPFYAQPLYSYFLAACHWMFGDGLVGVFFVQRLCVGATVIVLWRIAALLFDEKVGVAALVTAIVVAYEKLAGWSGVLLTETLFAPLICVWMYMLIRLARGANPRRWAVGAGLVGGLATLARSSLLLGWILVLPLLAIAVPRRRVSVIAIIVTLMIAVSSLATLRNWVVARQLVFISSEGPTVLFLGNSPPPLETPPAVKARYDRLGLDPHVQAVAEYARQQPRAFARGLWRKARFTLGWFGEMLPNSATSVFYIALWSLALVGVALMPWIRPTSLPLALIPLMLALSHFFAVILFQPHVYGDRLIVPLYLMIVPYVAVPLAAAERAISRFGRERTAAVLWTLLLLAATVRLAGGYNDLDVDVVAVAVLVGGVSLTGRPSLQPLRLALYASYALTVVAWFFRTPSAESALWLRTEALFIAIALISGAFLVDPATRSVSEKCEHTPSRPAPPAKNAQNMQVVPREARLLGACEAVLRRAPSKTAGWAFLGLAAIGAAFLAAGGFPAGLLTEFTKSLRNVFGYTAALSARAGLGIALLAFLIPSRMTRTRRALIYVAAAAMTLPALQWAGAGVDVRRALLRRQIATIGLAGGAAYAAIWIDSAWPAGGDLSTRAKQGVALGVFATAVLGAAIGNADMAMAAMAGLVIGGIQADRRRVRIG